MLSSGIFFCTHSLTLAEIESLKSFSSRQPFAFFAGAVCTYSLGFVLFSVGKLEAHMDCVRGKSSSYELLQGLKVDPFDTGVEDPLGDKWPEEV